MKVNYHKKIKGLNYVEDVLDHHGNKVSKILFNDDCKLIGDANDYLREMRLTRTGSYNTLNVIVRDLCHFYNFLTLAKISLHEVDRLVLSEFVSYLTKIDKCNNTYSIENSLLTKLPITKVEKSISIIKIRGFGRLDTKSIFRIVNNTINYLEFLKLNGKYLFNIDFEIMKTKKAKMRLLQSNNLHTIPHSINPVTIEQILSENQINRIKEKASRRNDYEKLLYFLLEKTGMRIGEVLGLQINEFDFIDIKRVSGDIFYSNNSWKVNIIWRGDNPHDSLVKNQSSRCISIKNFEGFEFELLLEKYLRFRKRILKNKKNKWLFISNKGTKLTHNTAYKRFKRNLKETCPESVSNITLHSWRHTFCTNELLNGTPLEFVAKLAGHKNPRTTFDTYIHYSGDHMEEVRRKYTSYMKKIDNFN